MEELFEVVIASVEGKLDHQWYLDLCVLKHVNSDESTLTNVTQLCCISNVILYDIVGKGDIHVKMPLGEIKNIANVLYILELKTNLLNMGKNNKSKLHCGV